MEHKLPHDFEGIFVELNLRKYKWLLFGPYHPPSQLDKYFFNHVKNGLDIYRKFYDKYMIVGHSNAEESKPCLLQLLFELNAKNIVKEPTCFQGLSNPSCNDLVITNSSSNFQNSKAILTGLLDFHKMVASVLKHTFHRSAPKELVYRGCKNFNRVIFKRELEDRLNQKINEHEHFKQIFLEILNIHASTKRKLLRANHVP